MRRRYSDFEWLKNELERDSKVRSCSDMPVPASELYESSCSNNFVRRGCGGQPPGLDFWLCEECQMMKDALSQMAVLLTGVILCFQIVVPPLPGKALKRQLPFRGDEGIFEESFIEERRQGLEQFINK